MTMTVTTTAAVTGVDPAPADRTRLALLAAEHARLLAAARAAVAAAELGQPDPVALVRGLLASTGQLPPAGASPSELLAQPLLAQVMAGGEPVFPIPSQPGCEGVPRGDL